MKGFRIFLFSGLLLILFSNQIIAQESGTGPIPDLQEFCSQQKGFNLLGKFDISWSNQGYSEKDLSTIHELGFNFVRLPVDYRTYTLYGNWDYFVEDWVKKIDLAIEYGQKYDVHVCLNLHRAPGYCVNSTTLPANQDLDLWTDTSAQNAFVNHWKFFTERYKDIPAIDLSFNLVNEPNNDVSEADYVKIMKRAIDTIHSISPNRLIFVDGLGYARQIILALKDEPNVAQAIHSYDPFQLTHYKASWVNGSDTWPVPQWPILYVSNFLYGPWKSEFRTTLVFQGNFPEGTEVIVNVNQVSIESTLRIRAGTQTILSKKFVCGPELGDDFTQIINTQWGYQNISNKDFAATLSQAATSLSFDNSTGDWMTINSISLKSGDEIYTYYLADNTWGSKQKTYVIDEDWNLKTTDGSEPFPFEAYQTNFDLALENNIPVMVQEFGVHNQTPHDVAVDFLADLSAFFREYNMGWALWNFTGSFGIMNSDRKDCTYESYQGYKLDREMLDALTKSGTTFTPNIFDDNSFLVFPSPASNELFFSNNNFKGKARVEIRDLSGRLVKNLEMEISGSEFSKLNVSSLNTGLFFLTVINQGKVNTAKFLVE